MTNPDDTALVSQFFSLFRTKADELGACSACIRMHPLLSNPAMLPGLPSTLVKQHGRTVSIDLTAPEQDTWHAIRSGHRYEIKRLQKTGFYAAIDDWRDLEAFKDMYRATMVRVSAHPSYQFQDKYFGDLKDALGNSLHLCSVKSPDGALAASALFTVTGDLAEYHLSGSASRFQRLAPTKLLLYAFAGWARAHGCSTLHLGGGVGAREDTLFQFKAGFSGRLHTFYTYRMIVNQDRYRALATANSGQCEVDAELADEFFPSYLASNIES